MDIYDALLHLQYPKITLINSKDVEAQILTGENRISLLSWLLQQNPQFNFPLLNKLKGLALEEELFKCYFQIGICSDKDKLLGKCSFKNQLSTLKLLLLFMRNINSSLREKVEGNEISINDKLQEYFEKDVNIIPEDLSISTKLSQAETNRYIAETRKNVEACGQIISDYKLQENESKPSVEEKLGNLQELKNEKYIQSIEKFTESFKNINLRSDTLKQPLPSLFNMNEVIHNMDINFSNFKQALDCKDEILNISIPTVLKTIDVPLTETVDESVLWLQRVSNIQTESDDLM